MKKSLLSLLKTFFKAEEAEENSIKKGIKPQKKVVVKKVDSRDITEEITINSNLIYRNGEKAIIICVDTGHVKFSIVSIDKNGAVHTHTKTGRISHIESQYDLRAKPKKEQNS